jgi:4'-phosphopantetheinyl transferase superfamily
MLGNDVVDLRDADSRPETFRPRFDARVFSAEELRAISRDQNPLARRWAHWAAKEAAFKLTKQIDSDFVFSPSRLSVEFEPQHHDSGRRVERDGVVRWTGTRSVSFPQIEVRSFETEDSVHVVALPMGTDWGGVDFAVEPLEVTEADPNAAVRNLAIREISRSLGVAQDRLRVGRRDSRGSGWRGGPPSRTPGASRIPTIELDGVETSLSLSLSHHGRFIGYAMTPRVEAAIRGSRRREPWVARAGAGAANL